MHLRRGEHPLAVEAQVPDERRPHLARQEAGRPLGEHRRVEGHPLVGAVDGLPALAGGPVERAAEGHERRHVGDGVPDPVAGTVTLDVQGLVEVHRPGRVERDVGDVGLVGTAVRGPTGGGTLGLGERVGRVRAVDAQLGADRGEAVAQGLLHGPRGVGVGRAQHDPGMRHGAQPNVRRLGRCSSSSRRRRRSGTGPAEVRPTRRRGPSPSWRRRGTEVAAALAGLGAGREAAQALGVSEGLLDEVARNLVLDTLPATPAAQVYTGVLYDALDLASLDTAARRRANRWLVVVSALHGAVRPGDRITAYRLAMGVSLPGVGPLAQHWRPALDGPLRAAAGRGAVVDCRSAAYAAAWRPGRDLAGRWVQVRVPGASHAAKHTRGLVARHLCVAGVAARSAPAVAEVVAEAFDVTLHEPTGAGAPWVLDVRAP